MINYIFNKDLITEIKRNIINFISRANINVNKVTFDLSLYTQFIISNSNNLDIKVAPPIIKNNKIRPSIIQIGGAYFDKIDEDFYIKPEYEDKLIYEVTRLLVKGASLKINYVDSVPTAIEGSGFIASDGNGFDLAFNAIISEDINNYTSPDFKDPYAFNNGIMRMILAIVGYKTAISSYFNHDKSLSVALYSLSVDNNIFSKINKKMTLINELINTKNNPKAIMSESEKEMIVDLINLKKSDLLNLVVNKFYIPYINSVPFDKRKKVRDEILKGFLGANYANLKINEINKENYYYASLINNTVPINNKITDQSWAYYRERALSENNSKLQEIYAHNALDNSKNGIKEFWIDVNNGKISINTNKKVIDEKKLVIEMLSYAYLNSIEASLKDQIEKGIIKLCNNKMGFTVTLKGNPLTNRMLTATVMQLAFKNGYNIEMIKVEDNIAYFKLKEPK